MAWYTGSKAANAVGDLIAILDVQLVKNAHWTIHDAAAGVSPGDLMVNGDFATNDYTGWTAGAGWSAATGKSVHSAGGGTATVTQTKAVKIGYYYDLVVVIAGRSAGTLTFSCTGASGGPVVYSADGTYTTRLLATNTSLVMTFTPTTTFDGNFDDVTLSQVITNCKVYKCLDAAENCLFYVKVDDEHLAFSVFELWEGWDAGTHAGTGVSLKSVGTSGDLRIYHSIGGWGLSLRDHCFIWQDFAGTRGGGYVGQPRRKDVSKNIVVFCGSGNTPTAANALGSPGGTTTYAWGSLFDELGNKVELGFSMSGGGSVACVKTITGEIDLRETPLTNTVTNLIMGELEGVASYGGAASAGIVTGDTCVIDGVTWTAIFQTTLTFVEQA